MRKIDKLLIQAQESYGDYGKFVSVCYIDLLEDGSYRSRVDLWDGVTGDMKPEDRIESNYSTLAEAITALEETIDEKNRHSRKASKREVPVIINGGMQA